VTHGFLLDDDGDSLKPLADAIVDRTDGCLLDYQLAQEGGQGVFLSICSPGTEEVVILFDWGVESNELSNGWGEAAADALFSLLVREELLDPTLDQLNLPYHFIGHSFGTAVTSEVVERFAAFDIPVDHLTYLDPHDFDQDNLPVDGEQRLFTLGLPQGYGATVWDNVAFADVYYQTRGLNGALIPDVGVPLGRPIPGAYNRLLDGSDELPESYALLDAAGDHSYVWTGFYLGTVLGQLPPDSPVPAQPTNYASTGYAFSRVRSGQALRPIPVLYSGQDHVYSEPGLRIRANIKQKPAWTPNQIVNGDFEAIGSRTLVNDVVPGWSHHGGGGDGDVNPRDNGNDYLELSDGEGEQIREHNYLYVPAEKGNLYLEFDVRRIDPSNNDVLEVRLGDNRGTGPSQVLARLALSDTDASFARRCVSIPNSLRNQSHTLAFEIDPNGTAVNSVVRIDNLSFASKCSRTSNTTRTVQFANASFAVHEATGTAVIEVRLSDPSDELVAVEFATKSGSAKASIDYTETAQSVIFSPGESVAYVEVPIQQDNQTAEPTETVKLNLRLPRGAKLGKLKAATLSISG
jgi:pimeloyl-ACP methyl ester carboxylesterase